MIFSKQKIEEVKSRSSLADLASEVTDLKPSGSNLVGLSPFQTEKTPSFYIYDGGSRYKCFSSGKSGSVFDFVMETRGMSFPEAVEFLAQKAGIVLEGESEKSNFHAQRAKELSVLVEIAAKEYQEVLVNTKHAKSYLKDRGISQDSMQNYVLGFAPDAWNFILDKTAEKVKTTLKIDDSRLNELFLQAGLIKKKDDSGYYDAFRSRVIFPIRAKDGKYIALGGRILEANTNAPKYLNSSESLIYEKRSVLYGLFEGMDAIRRSRHVYIVEGYIDVISMFQKGFKDVVASCGTAFGAEHVSQISKLVNSVTAIFDADVAGRKAAARCFESFINTGIESYAVLLPAGEDPDSLCRANSSNKVEQVFNQNKVLLFDFYVSAIVEELGTQVASLDLLKKIEPAKKGEVAKRILKTLTKVINPVERESLISRLAEVLDVKLTSIRELYNSESSFLQKSAKYTANKFQSETKEQTVALESSEAKLSPALEIYLKQLIVSALCEPSVISIIASSTSFFDQRLISEGHSGKLKALLAEFTERGFAGLSLEDEATTRKQHNMAVACLEKFNFIPKSYIPEAYRQLQLGGAAPEAMAEEMQTVSKRLSLRSELEVIRLQENNVQDASQLEKLAQEKLLKKRQLKNKVVSA